jgi:hypothetical protein
MEKKQNDSDSDSESDSDDSVENIKKDFINVLLLRKNIINVIETLSDKISWLKKTYKHMIKTNITETSESASHSMFGIDAFLFQNKLIEIEYEHIFTLYKTIDNRIYYEYNKLYRMVQDYIKKEFSEINEIKIDNKEFPAYKQLNPTKEYDISNTIEIQSIIFKAITDMTCYFDKKEMELNENKKKIKRGMHIDNLIHTQKFRNAVLKNNIDMFTHYLQTFNHHHTNHLSELLKRSEYVLNNIKIHSKNHTVDNANANVNVNDNPIAIANNNENISIAIECVDADKNKICK